MRGAAVKGYCSVQDAAKCRDISARRANQCAPDGKIPGEQRPPGGSPGDAGRRGPAGEASGEVRAERNGGEKRQEGQNR